MAGAVHMAGLLTPHLMKQQEAAIINVSSSLGFTNAAFAPTYGASKVRTPPFNGTGSACCALLSFLLRQRLCFDLHYIN